MIGSARVFVLLQIVLGCDDPGFADNSKRIDDGQIFINGSTVAYVCDPHHFGQEGTSYHVNQFKEK